MMIMIIVIRYNEIFVDYHHILWVAITIIIVVVIARMLEDLLFLLIEIEKFSKIHFIAIQPGLFFCLRMTLFY